MAKYRLLLCALYLMLVFTASANPWARVEQPFDGHSDAIGSYSNGCLSGGVGLASEGEGFQVIRTSRKRYYGHAELVSFIQEYAATLNKAGLDDLLIGDMSMPRGGHFTSGHRSHQIGLDVDIWLRQANRKLTAQEIEKPQKLDVVNRQAFKVNANWSDAHGVMIRQAALDKRVARIFVHPVIKQQLCSQAERGSAWLQKVRPWWGHSSHMHIRLKCPDNNQLCEGQDLPPEGDGCDKLSWWQEQMSAPKKVNNSEKKPKPKPKKSKPMQCTPLLGSGL